MKALLHIEEPKNPPAKSSSAPNQAEKIERLEKENAYLVSQIRAMESMLIHHFLFSQQKVSIILEVLSELNDVFLRHMLSPRPSRQVDKRGSMSEVSLDAGVETERTPSPAALHLQPCPYPSEIMAANKQRAMPDVGDAQLSRIHSMARDICHDLQLVSCLFSEIQGVAEEPGSLTNRSSLHEMPDLCSSFSESHLQAKFMAKLAEAVPERFRERLSLEAWEAARIAHEQEEDERDELNESCDESSSQPLPRPLKTERNPNRLDLPRRTPGNARGQVEEVRKSAERPASASKFQSPRQARLSKSEKTPASRKHLSDDGGEKSERKGRQPTL
eukprot:16191-Hanusia_phi.AAC.1